MLEISEDQNLDLNSGVQQRLLALEQLSFTMSIDDHGNGYSGCSGSTPSPSAPSRWIAA
jgi:hypothetical protein